MDVSPLSQRVRFILCEPSHPGNIGSAARAIKTMGFRDLRVVKPRIAEYKTDPEAIAYATSSIDVLEASRAHETLAEALEGVTFAWALTGYDREYGPPMSLMREAAQKSESWLEQMQGGVAFVFGTERSGLLNEEVMLCQGCAAIPADPQSKSLNLSQAVQVAAYEMQMALLGAAGHEGDYYDWQLRFEHEAPAPAVAVEGFFRHWEQAMIAIGIHDPKHPKLLMPICRRLFSRAGMTQTEVDLLRGICAAIIRSKVDRKGAKSGAADAASEAPRIRNGHVVKIGDPDNWPIG